MRRRSVLWFALVLTACSQTPEDASGAVSKAGKKRDAKIQAKVEPTKEVKPLPTADKDARSKLGLRPGAGQEQLSKKLDEEVVKALGPAGSKQLRAVKTGADLKKLLTQVKDKCPTCTVSSELLAGVTKLDTVGTVNVGRAPEMQAAGGCGPFHCLSWWGEHFPCQGMPGDDDSGDKKDPDPGDKKEPDETEPADPSGGGEGGEQELRP